MRGGHDTPGLVDHGFGHAEDVVGQRHLARMDAAFADEPQLLRHLRFGAETVGVGHVRPGAVAGEHTGFGGGHFHGKQGGVHVRRITGDAVGREKVAQSQLQAGHARMRGRQLGCQAQPARGFDVDQQADRAADAIGHFGLFQRRDHVTHLRHGFDLGNIEQPHARHGHRGQIGAEVRAVGAIGTHDDQLAAGADVGAGEEVSHLIASGLLAGLGHRIFQIERQGIGRTGQGLVEQLRTCAGHKQLATHGFPSY
ncbi:hypothetical protein D3C81_1269230 [compost metagenome]